MPRYLINLIPEKKSKSKLDWLANIVSFAVVLLALAISMRANGADLSPVAGLTANDVAQTVRAETIKPGTYGLGLAVDRRGDHLMRDGEKTGHGYQSMHRASFLFGLGLTDKIDVNVGLSATSETQEGAPVDTGFSGASLTARMLLVEQGRFRLGLAPFIAAGAGSKGSAAYSRSEKESGGWMVLADIGEPGVAHLHVNWGYRYRHREVWGDYVARNEMFYKAAVNAHVTRQLSLVVAADGRQVQLADQTLIGEEGKFSPVSMLEGRLGAELNLPRSTVGLFAGQHLGESVVAGNGLNFLASFTYRFGQERRQLADEFYRQPEALNREPKPTEEKVEDELDQWQKSLNEKKESADAAEKNKKKTEKKEDEFKGFPETKDFFSENDQDLSKILGQDPESMDWNQVRLQREKQAADPNLKGPSPEEKLEAELAALREKQEQERLAEEKRQKIEYEQERRRQRQMFEQEQKLLERYRRETSRDVQRLPTFSDEELNWNGLN